MPFPRFFGGRGLFFFLGVGWPGFRFPFSFPFSASFSWCQRLSALPDPLPFSGWSSPSAISPPFSPLFRPLFPYKRPQEHSSPQTASASSFTTGFFLHTFSLDLGRFSSPSFPPGRSPPLSPVWIHLFRLRMGSPVDFYTPRSSPQLESLRLFPANVLGPFFTFLPLFFPLGLFFFFRELDGFSLLFLMHGALAPSPSGSSRLYAFSSFPYFLF